MEIKFNISNEKFDVIDSDSEVYPIIEIAENEDIVFYTPHGEMLRLCGNGDFVVKGKKVTNDMEIYHSMKEFFFQMRGA